MRDVYAFFPILMKYCDLHRAQWLKTPSWETDGIYENVAVIFKVLYLFLISLNQIFIHLVYTFSLDLVFVTTF